MPGAEGVPILDFFKNVSMVFHYRLNLTFTGYFSYNKTMTNSAPIDCLQYYNKTEKLIGLSGIDSELW